jgi:hypothetical protein
MNELDEHFFDRADEHIRLSNNQLVDIDKGKVSASMMYSVARFNAWVSALRFDNPKEMKKAKKEIIKYYVSQYEKMLIENIDDYIDNFEDLNKK